MIGLALSLLLILILSLPVMADGAYFSPYIDCKIPIINLISSSKASIRLAMYAINDPDIVNALIASKVRGVDVQIITDASMSSNNRQKAAIIKLKAAGVLVYIGRSLKHNLIHTKFAVFDSSIVEEGSFNWTVQALSQDNTMNILTNSSIAEKFTGFWNMILKDLK